jgi:hypothetical protein
MGSASIVLAGLASALLVANSAIDPGLPSSVQANASSVTQRIRGDLQFSTGFTERTSRTLTMTVPDRTGDGIPDTIRYAWSGNSGDPLTVSLNEQAAETLLADVQTFDLSFLTRTVVAPVIESQASGPVLLFVSGSNTFRKDSKTGNSVVSVSKLEQYRIDQFEDWGYSTESVAATVSDSDLKQQSDKADVVFISGEVDPNLLNPSILSLAVGLVCEQLTLCEELGFSRNPHDFKGDKVQVSATTHYITHGFNSGLATVADRSIVLHSLDREFSPDILVLARGAGREREGALSLLSPGDEIVRSTDKVAGRRVMLPWGTQSFDVRWLTSDGLTLLQRSIEWAAGAETSTYDTRVLFIVDSSTDPSDAELDRRFLLAASGLTVDFVSINSSQTKLDQAIASTDVIIVGSSLNAKDVSKLVVPSQKGIFAETSQWLSPLGFGNTTTTLQTSEFPVKDSTHPTLQSTKANPVLVFSSSQTLPFPTSPFPTGLQVVLQASKNASNTAGLAIFEQGATTQTGTAAGRRSWLGTFDVASCKLKPDVQTLYRDVVLWTGSSTAVKSGTKSTTSTTLADFFTNLLAR